MIHHIPVGQPDYWYAPDYEGHWNGVAWLTFHGYGTQAQRCAGDAERWADSQRKLGDVSRVPLKDGPGAPPGSTAATARGTTPVPPPPRKPCGNTRADARQEA